MSEGHTLPNTKRGTPIVCAGHEVEGFKPVDYGGRGMRTHGQDVGVIHIGEQEHSRHLERICKFGHQL